MKTRNEIYKGINNKIDHQYAVLEVLLDIRDSLTEKKLPVECDLKVSNFHCSEHGYIKPIPKCPKCAEPEKTAESWEKMKANEIVDEFISIVNDWLPIDRRRKVADLANEFLFEAIMSLLTSHTEQKKEELEKSIKSLQTYSRIDGEPIDDGRMLSKNDVLHLIKEL